MEIIGLDVGDRLIGVARASTIARIPEPLKALPNNGTFSGLLLELIRARGVQKIVVGMPRNMSGELTQQSRKIRGFIDQLSSELTIPVIVVDESLSSLRADEFLSQSKRQYDQDSVAACYILEEYFTTIKEKASEV